MTYRPMTERLRRALRQYLRDFDITYTTVAEQADLGLDTVWRFINDRPIRTSSLDRIVKWMEHEGFVWGLDIPPHAKL